jgi:hypothetical protein
MPTADYYREKAKECFDHALSAKDKEQAQEWQRRGREYAEIALAMDAETGKGTDPSSKL